MSISQAAKISIKADSLNKFDDSDKLDSYARESMAAMVSEEITKGIE